MANHLSLYSLCLQLQRTIASMRKAPEVSSHLCLNCELCRRHVFLLLIMQLFKLAIALRVIRTCTTSNLTYWHSIFLVLHHHALHVSLVYHTHMAALSGTRSPGYVRAETPHSVPAFSSH